MKYTIKNSIVNNYLESESFDVLENANKYPGPSGFFTYVAERALSSEIEDVIPKEIYKLHLNGLVYIHKLPYSVFIPYCSGHSLERLLKKGLKTPTISSFPAKHLDTFSDHVSNYLMTMQHYFTGAQAFGAVELYAGAFIKKDNLSYKEIKQNVQRMIFNLNFPSRIGMQTPFTNFTIVLDSSKKKLDGDYAFVDGKKTGMLGSYLEQAKWFLKALYEIHSNGDSVGRPFTFPIPTIMSTSKLIYDDPELFDSVFTAVAKRGTGYWLNTRIVNPDTSYAMCCRINIDVKELLHAQKIGGLRLEDLKKKLEEARENYLKSIEKTRMGGLWAVPDITGSKNVISINLPRIVLEASFDDTKIIEIIESTLETIRKGLLWFSDQYIRYGKKYYDFYRMIHEYTPEILRSLGTPYFLTVGIIGLPEAAALLERESKAWVDGNHKLRKRMASWMEKIIDIIVRKAREWSIKNGIPFNVEEVPGESAAAKLAYNDVIKYPELLEYFPGKEDVVYSTSIVPYYSSLDLWERIEIEEKIQQKFTGGVMMHIFLNEEADKEALAKLTRKITYTTSIVYWSYTPALSVCPKCGWNGIGITTECPNCGADTEIWSRIIGYYRPLKNWNLSRRKEFWTRKHFQL